MNKALEEKGVEVTYFGYVQCFCDSRAAQGDPKSMVYGNNGSQICLEYLDSKLTTFLASNSITVVITVINVIIRNVTIRLIMTIGYDTHSEQVTAITNGVFVA